MRSTHSGRLERWLGRELVEGIALQSRGFRHPIALAGVPGAVYVMDGDYIGVIQGGGFASLHDLISEATTGGKKQVLRYTKTGVAAPAVAASQSLWGVGALPAAGAIAGAAPGGTVPARNAIGALAQVNAAGGDTLHFVTWTGAGTQSSAVLLYDYLWGVNINHATTSSAITGVPTRYQTAALAPGNFLAGRVTTVLAATAHNITVTYVDDAGNVAEAGAAQAIRVSAAVQTTPLTQPQWFYTLNAGDRGLRNVTNIALSAASTGNVDWYIAHAIAILPILVSNTPFVLDGINSAFNLERIYDDACLALMEWFKIATGAATYSGEIAVVSG